MQKKLTNFSSNEDIISNMWHDIQGYEKGSLRQEDKKKQKGRKMGLYLGEITYQLGKAVVTSKSIKH